jgi:Gas vesicle protein G
MGLLTLPFRLPFLPVDGVIWLAELIGEEAERQLNDPARIRRELEEAERLRAAGEITDEELAQIQREVTSRLVGPVAPTTTGGEDHG